MLVQVVRKIRKTYQTIKPSETKVQYNQTNNLSLGSDVINN